MSPDASIAGQVLQQWGATVEPLPTSDKEESDWLAQLEGCSLLVEEKTKFDDPASLAARAAAFAAGQVHGSITPVTHNNRISGIVRKAASQLRSTAPDMTHDLRILWFTGIGHSGEARHHQFMATLYGSTRIFELDRPVMKPCYFFRNSDFFRYREYLDGAVAAYVHENNVTMKLCLNPCSSTCDALGESPYAKRFKLGLVDPVAEENAGEAYIVDADIARSDEPTIIQFLEQEYGLTRAMHMDMNMATATVLLPRER